MKYNKKYQSAQSLAEIVQLFAKYFESVYEIDDKPFVFEDFREKNNLNDTI